MIERYTISVWETPGLVEALRKQAAPGVFTASELAMQLSERFSIELSRNAIMGKCWRENIPLRGRKGPEPKAPSAPKPPKPQAIINELFEGPTTSSAANC